jgi:hypothetical protein
VVDDVDADDDDVPQAAIVVVSETVEAKRVGNEYIDLANPIVCLEGRLWDDMKMTPPGAPSDHRTIEIVDPDSSMAAGLSGSIRVVAGQTGGTYWGEPSASADVIAKTPSNLVVLFRYDAGKTMALGTKAQGPRVGFGVDALPDTGDSALTVEGLWLFRASVVWAAAAD